MAIKTPPAGTVYRAIEWRLQQPAQVNRSGYTGARQVIGLPGGSRWSAVAEFIPFVSDAAARGWRGFLASLDGQVHTFYMPVYGGNQHAGVNPTATVSAGASVATLSAAIGLKSGQYMTFTLASGKRQLVIVTADMADATVQFRPRLRESSTGVVETVSPYAEVALTGDSVTWLSKPGPMFDLAAIEVEEAF